MLRMLTRSTLIFIVVLLYTSTATAQSFDVYQGDSLYKAKKVKYRIMRATYNPHYNNISDVFDRNGHLIAKYEFDSSGIQPIRKEIFNLDSLQRYSSGKIYFYYVRDPKSKVKVPTDEPDPRKTITCTVAYDSVSYSSHETAVDTKGTLLFEKTFTYGPYSMQQKDYYSDGKVHRVKTEFERPWVEKNETEEIDSAGVVLYHKEWSYKNKYDKDQRLMARKVTAKTTVKGKEVRTIYYSECTYRYNPQGLLIEKRFSERSDNTDWIYSLRFDYKFWE